MFEKLILSGNDLFWSRVIAVLVCFLFIIFYNFFFPSTNKYIPRRSNELSGWPQNCSLNVTDYVQTQRDTVLMEPCNICSNKIFLLIIVCSRVDDFGGRRNIRKTWGNTTAFNYQLFNQLHQYSRGKYLNPSSERLEYYRDYIKGINIDLHQTNVTTVSSSIPVRVVFIVGRKKYYPLVNNCQMRLYSESKQYDDIIQENFIDSYKNLTLKSVMALKWVTTRRCHQTCAFILKCDDDTFVNIPNLLHFLLGGTIPLYFDVLDVYENKSTVLANRFRLNATHDLLMGHLFINAYPIPNLNSKWYMPYYMFPRPKYPKYLSGASYLMSSDVIPRLYAAAINTSLIYLEDVFITGVCAERIKLDRSHNPLFHFRHIKSPCTMKGTLTQHRFKNNNLMTMYALLVDLSVKCVLAESSSDVKDLEYEQTYQY